MVARNSTAAPAAEHQNEGSTPVRLHRIDAEAYDSGHAFLGEAMALLDLLVEIAPRVDALAEKRSLQTSLTVARERCELASHALTSRDELASHAPAAAIPAQPGGSDLHLYIENVELHARLVVELVAQLHENNSEAIIAGALELARKVRRDLVALYERVAGSSLYPADEEGAI